VIKGYEGLEVDVFFTPSFQALVDVKYAARAPGATALAPPFKDAFAAGFFEEKPAFDAAFEAEPPLALAELGEEVAAAGGRDGGALRVLRSTLAAAGPALRGLHARLQPLLLFFVDAAQSIDQDDPRWELLLAVETAGPGGAAEVVGFATLYNFWVFPDRRRLRVSQVLVLPPHQGRGVGSLLLRAASAVAERSGAVDLTVSATATRSWGVYMRVCGWVVGGGGSCYWAFGKLCAACLTATQGAQRLRCWSRPLHAAADITSSCRARCPRSTRTPPTTSKLCATGWTCSAWRRWMACPPRPRRTSPPPWPPPPPAPRPRPPPPAASWSRRPRCWPACSGSCA
jgi:GNAT superfamily N-acetyltransferase